MLDFYRFLVLLVGAKKGSNTAAKGEGASFIYIYKITVWQRYFAYILIILFVSVLGPMLCLC